MRRFLVRYRWAEGGHWWYFQQGSRSDDPFGSETRSNLHATRLDKCRADAVYHEHKHGVPLDVVEVLEVRR